MLCSECADGLNVLVTAQNDLEVGNGCLTQDITIFNSKGHLQRILRSRFKECHNFIGAGLHNEQDGGG